MLANHETPPSTLHAPLLSLREDFKLVSAAFPRIAEKLAFFWGEPEFPALIENLEQDDRNGHRAGFPADVLMALNSLADAHDAAYPALARKEKDFWNLSKAR